MIVEVCAASLQSAVRAERAGADRIELCAELGVGGITPSPGLLQKVRDALRIPVHVLIRPRSGHFTYSDSEYEVMCRDIAFCARLGFEGVVAGILEEDHRLDNRRTEGLMVHKGSMHFTFHRAFDWIPDPLNALKELEALGVDTILSSGQAPSAPEGLPLLKEMLHRAANLTVMPGAGIRPANVLTFKQQGFRAVHLSAAALEKGKVSGHPLPLLSPSLLSEDEVVASQESVIRKVVEIVKENVNPTVRP